MTTGGGLGGRGKWEGFSAKEAGQISYEGARRDFPRISKWEQGKDMLILGFYQMSTG